MGMRFTGSWESAIFFSPITPNVNFVETLNFMFLETETSGIKNKFQLNIQACLL